MFRKFRPANIPCLWPGCHRAFKSLVGRKRHQAAAHEEPQVAAQPNNLEPEPDYDMVEPMDAGGEPPYLPEDVRASPGVEPGESVVETHPHLTGKRVDL